MGLRLGFWARAASKRAGGGSGGGGGGVGGPFLYSDGTQVRYMDGTPVYYAGQTWTTGGSGGSQTDQTGLTFVDSAGISSTYHLYAGGLNWSQRVGILIYTDGSGEFGLANPTSTYLLAGASGMVAVAKEHNMILLTPRAPGNGCTDGDGRCWYMNSFDGTTTAQKINWSRELVNYIYTRYNIDLERVAFGGYSSGAQWTTQYFGPGHAAQIMEDGVAVAISYGGEPLVTPTHTLDHKAKVPYVWDTGALDPAYTNSGSIYGVVQGEDWYSTNGFTTQLHVISGVDHDRDGEFGGIMDREITEHVIPAS